MLKAIGDQVILRSRAKAQSEFDGIHIPMAHQRKPCEKVVVDVGPNATMHDLKPGELVIRKELRVENFTFDNEDYELVPESAIVAKLPGKE